MGGGRAWSSKLREKVRGLSVRMEGLGSTQPHCSELVTLKRSWPLWKERGMAVKNKDTLKAQGRVYVHA